MLFIKQCWDWCVKHWKLLLVSIGGFIAFLIGYTRASRETRRVKLELDLANKDKDLIEENNTKFHDSVVESVLDYEEKKAKIISKKEKALSKIKKQKEETKKEILNSDEKLDKILKDKWGLKNEPE